MVVLRVAAGTAGFGLTACRIERLKVDGIIRGLAVCPLPGYTRDPKRTVAPVLLANSQGSGFTTGAFFSEIEI